MIHGLDTGFLVAAEVAEHADHTAAQETLGRLIAASDQIAIAPQLLAEFIHIVTDPRRFSKPLDIAAARNAAEQWWTARDAVRVFPDDGATRQFLSWLQQFSFAENDCSTHCSPRPICKPVSNRCSRPIRPTSVSSAYSPA